MVRNIKKNNKKKFFEEIPVEIVGGRKGVRRTFLIRYSCMLQIIYQM
jgi:hypothetical protein